MKEKKIFRIEDYATGLNPELVELIEKARSAWEENDGERLSQEWERKRNESRIEYLYKISGMDSFSRKKTFENFEVNSHNRRAYFLVQSYVEDWQFARDSGIVLMGNLGVGKTHLCLALINKLISEQLVGCEYANVSLILDAIKNSFDGNEVNPVLRFNRRELVILDDLGSERSTDWSIQALTSIIVARYERHLPTIFTTNARNWDELIDMIAGNFERLPAERLVERILERNQVVTINGRSWRKALKMAFGLGARREGDKLKEN